MFAFAVCFLRESFLAISGIAFTSLPDGDTDSDADVSDGDSDSDLVDGDSDTIDGDTDGDSVLLDCIYHDDCPTLQSCDLALRQCETDINAYECINDGDHECPEEYYCMHSGPPEYRGKCIPEFCSDVPYLCISEEVVECDSHLDCPLFRSCWSEYHYCGSDGNADSCMPDEMECVDGYTCIIRSDTTIGRCTPDSEIFPPE